MKACRRKPQRFQRTEQRIERRWRHLSAGTSTVSPRIVVRDVFALASPSTTCSAAEMTPDGRRRVICRRLFRLPMPIRPVGGTNNRATQLHNLRQLEAR